MWIQLHYVGEFIVIIIITLVLCQYYYTRGTCEESTASGIWYYTT